MFHTWRGKLRRLGVPLPSLHSWRGDAAQRETGTIYLPHSQLQDRPAKALRKKSEAGESVLHTPPEVGCKTRENTMASNWRKTDTRNGKENTGPCINFTGIQGKKRAKRALHRLHTRLAVWNTAPAQGQLERVPASC